MNMCKFSSSNDVGYKRVTQEIKDVIKKAIKSRISVQGTSRSPPLLTDGTQGSCQGLSDFVVEVEEAS